MKKKIKELVIGYHKVKPIKPINKTKSRFGYSIYVKGKKIKGLWELDGTNINKGTYIYKRIEEKPKIKKITKKRKK